MRVPGSSALEELRCQLEADRCHLLEALVHGNGAPATGSPPDAADPIWAQLRRDLDEVDAALARLGAATFGMCERCGRPILLARLRATPTVRICLGCEVEAGRWAWAELFAPADDS